MKTDLEILKEARASITDWENWSPTGWGYVTGTKCAVHAIVATAPCESTNNRLTILVGSYSGVYDHEPMYLGRYNDTHSHAEVLALFDAAIADLEAQESAAAPSDARELVPA